MNGEQISKTLNDACDESKENTLRSMLKEFYSRQMFTVVAFVWFWAVIFIAGAVFCAIRFFNADQTSDQIMFAAIFICCWQGLGLIKIFAWQMIHRSHTERQIKKVELRIAELNDMIKSK
jgi:hypothetical protein